MKKKEFYEYAQAYDLNWDVVEKILCKILQCDKEALFLKDEIPASHLYEFQKYLYEFQKWIPEAYIFWEKEFYGRFFYVHESTLIPRRETELLVDVLRKKCLDNADMNTSSYIDVGTWTGCIWISMILELLPLQFKHIYCIDINDSILQLTQKNIERYHISTNIQLIISSVFDVFFQQKFDMQENVYISANLPYIKKWDHNTSNHVVKNEPETALYWWEETWFELYKKLLSQCFLLKKVYWVKQIHLCIEIWYDQYEYSKNFLEEMWLQFEYFTDIHNIKRVIYITGF